MVNLIELGMGYPWAFEEESVVANTAKDCCEIEWGNLQMRLDKTR